MLGENLSDPHGVEAGGTMRGIGLLPVDTVFAEHKTRTQVCGKFLELDEEFAPLKNVEFTGYEIHMGESTWKNGAVASTSTCDTVTGTEKTEGTFITMYAELMFMAFLIKKRLHLVLFVQ